MTTPTPGLPYDRATAIAAADSDGYATVTVAIPQDDYLAAYGSWASACDTSHWDAAHAAAYTGGLPYDCDATIVGVGPTDDPDTGGDLYIRYTTDIRSGWRDKP